MDVPVKVLEGFGEGSGERCEGLLLTVGHLNEREALVLGWPPLLGDDLHAVFFFQVRPIVPGRDFARGRGRRTAGVVGRRRLG